MTNAELSSLLEWIEDRWPNIGHLRHWEAVAMDFAHIPSAAVREAATNHYNAGNSRAPSWSELRAEAVRLAAARGLTDPRDTSCDVRGGHSRNQAIIELHDKPGYREAMCLDCGATRVREAKHLPTVGEVEEMQSAGRPDDPSYDALTERIAP